MNARARKRLVLVAEIVLGVIIISLLFATWLPAIIGNR